MPDGELLSLSQKYQAMVYYGNALFHQAQYMKAEVSCKVYNCIAAMFCSTRHSTQGSVNVIVMFPEVGWHSQNVM